MLQVGILVMSMLLPFVDNADTNLMTASPRYSSRAMCCVFSATPSGALRVKVIESGAPAKPKKQKKRTTPYMGVFERSLRIEGESECQICSGQTAQMTRCPRCSPGQPAVHAVCEEEWLMRHGKCMFCRLPVRKPLEPGAKPQDTRWSWR
jgi:hypothetical protein